MVLFSRLERYVLRESLLPFLIGFGICTFLLLLTTLFDLLNLLLAKGIPLLMVSKLFALTLGWISALTVPCGVLVASLMTFGRLAQDNEITAMRGLGLAPARLLRAPLAVSVLMAAALAIFNCFALPEMNLQLKGLLVDIAQKRPTIRIEPGVFMNDFDDYSLLVKGIDHASGEMTQVTVFDHTEDTAPTTVLAARGRMRLLDGGNALRLDLEDGEIHVLSGEVGEGKYRRGRFTTFSMTLADPDDEGGQGGPGRDQRSMNVLQLAARVRSHESVEEGLRTLAEERAVQTGFSSYRELERALGRSSGLAQIRELMPPTGGSGSGSEDPASSVAAAAAVSLAGLRWKLQSIDREKSSLWVEIHKKFSIPVACVVFVLVGAPLGIRTRMRGFANLAVAMSFFLAYYLFLLGGEQLADRLWLSPSLSMWLPNIVFGSLGILLTVSVAGWGPSRGMR